MAKDSLSSTVLVAFVAFVAVGAVVGMAKVRKECCPNANQ